VALIALGIVLFRPAHEEQVAKKETTFARVMRTQILRCAYEVWPPFLSRDSKNGKLSGVYYELLEKMGRDLHLKIEWAEEVGKAAMFEGFQTGRYDAFCSAITPSPGRALAGDFTRPFGYVPFFLYAREGDNRFDNNYGAANSEAIALVAADGDLTAIITREVFPKAKALSLPDLTNGADILMTVASGKADATVNDSNIARAFIANNPGKIKQAKGLPLRFPSMSIALPAGEERLRQILDLTLTHYLETGVIERIFMTYGLDETKILRVAKPYQTGIAEHE